MGLFEPHPADPPKREVGMSDRSKTHQLLGQLMKESCRCHYCGKPVERYNEIFHSFGVDPVDGIGALDTFQRRYLFSFMATVDHVVARQDGGKTIRANVVLACWGCNQARHRKPRNK